uniref:Reverse transcriptase Ty1/copia-type domain-containing protein n=1 Tax=Tanacetum cinerariifolium TaxID=118510 RepID=A0A699H8A5_TANCI|nr:hypothetical protein [Tanacetum cinerariifolium]
MFHYDWSFQAEEEPTNYALIAFTSSSSSSPDNEVASCSKACTKAYASLQSHYDKLTNDLRKSQFDVLSYKTDLESVEARLLVYQQNETVFEEDIKLLKLDGKLRDNALVALRQKFEKAEQERDELKLKLDKPSVPIIEDWVSDSKDESKGEPIQNAPSFVHPPEHVKTPRPFVKPVEHPIPANNLRNNSPKSRGHSNSRTNKACFVLLLTRSKLVPLTAARPVTTVVPHNNVTRPMPAKTVVTKPYSPPGRTINRSSSPKPSNFPPKVTTVKAPKVNPVKGVQGNWLSLGSQRDTNLLIDIGCSRHMTGNMFYLSDFEEINGEYVAFVGNPKGGKITGNDKIRTGKLDFDDVHFVKELKFNLFSVLQMCDKKNSILFTDAECIILSFDFKLPDDNHVLHRVPRENNMYNVDLKNIIPSGDLTCLFAKATLDEKNMTLIEAARTILEDSLLPIPFWVEAVNTACYVQNRVLVTKPHNKTPYEPLLGKTPSIGFMRPFGCSVTIFNTLDPLSKFNGKAGEGFLVGYSVSKNKPNVARSGPTWLFDIDTLIKSMNYQPVIAGNQPNPSADPQNTDDDATFKVKEPKFKGKKPDSEVHVSPSSSAKTKKHDDKTKREAKGKSPVELSIEFRNLSEEFEDLSNNSINEVNAASTPVSAFGQITTNSTNTFSVAGPSNTDVSPTLEKSSYVDPSQYPDDPNMPALEDITYSDDQKDVGAEVDFTNLETTIVVSPIPTTRVHKDHHVTQIIGDLSLATQTRSMTRMVKDQEPKRVHQALKDPSWIEAMQEELLQFKMQKVWVLVDLPKGKRVIGLKWVFRNKKDERGIIVRNKAQLVAQDTQEEGIDYKEVFALVARIESIRLFLAYASYMGFMMYQMDVKSAFLYGTIEEERGKIDQTLFIKKQKGDILLVQVYVDDFIFGSTNKYLCKAFEKLMKDKFQMSSMGELTFFLGLQVKQKPDGIFISHDKYVAENLRKFGLTDGKSASTPIDTEKPLLKDPDGEDVDVHTYSSSMASAVIFLAIGRKFNFLKYLFDSLVRNVDSSSKFYMYPRFLQLIIRAQVETPLFEGMLVSQQAADDVANVAVANVDDVVVEDADKPTPSSPTPPPPQELPSTSQGIIAKIDTDKDVILEEVDAAKDAEVEKNADVQGRLEESQAKVYHIDLEHVDKVLSMQDDEPEPAELKEVIEVVTTAKLMTEVVTAAATTAVSLTVL